MKDIIYLKGDATEPIGTGHKIIAHVCNDVGGWGAGFVLALSRKWKDPEISYRNAIKNHLGLGDCSIAYVREDITVINMIAQAGYVSRNNTVAIRYNALRICFEKMLDYIKFHNATVHMPRIGCGLAGGSWDKVESVIKETLCKNDIQVYVYDL